MQRKYYLLRIAATLAIVVFLFSLLGCSSDKDIQKSREKLFPKDPPKTILIHKLHSYILKFPTKNDPTGVIAIPRGDLFNSNTTSFTSQAKSILSNTADFLNFYEKEDMSAIAVIKTSKSLRYENREQNVIHTAITKKQAGLVMDYLWSKDINTQLTYVQSGDKNATDIPELETFRMHNENPENFFIFTFKEIN
jgi:hypothetical protein